MPHVYLLDILILCIIAYPFVRRLIEKLTSPTENGARVALGIGGLAMLASRVGLILFYVAMQFYRPATSIGSDLEPYFQFRPVGLGINVGDDDCKPSAYWFPDGWRPD